MTARSTIIDCQAKWTTAPATLLLAALAATLLLTPVCLADPVEDQRKSHSANPASDTIRFDIPSQLLQDALMVYAEISGVEVFVEHTLATGQYSNTLRGEYSAEMALRTLLTGTGLQIRRAAERAYTVVAPAMQEPAIGRAPSWSSDRERVAFFAALQAAIMNALCMRSNLVPGQYRVAFAVWIDPIGKVTDARILTSQISDDVSGGIVESVRNVSIGQPLPAGLKQPVTFVVLTKSPDRTGDCVALRSGRG